MSAPLVHRPFKRQGEFELIVKHPLSASNWHACTALITMQRGQRSWQSYLHAFSAGRGVGSRTILGDELRSLPRLQREWEPKSPFVLVQSARMIERAGAEAGFSRQITSYRIFG